MSSRTVGCFPAGISCVWPSMPFEAVANALYEGFFVPPFAISPLYHVSSLESRRMNQTNISTYWFFAARSSTVFASAACWAFETPPAYGGRVCSPYSVTQIGTRRWNHCSSDLPNWVRRFIVTFGYAALAFGPRRGSVGYGCVAQASNGSFGSACESRWANVAGATVSLAIPLAGLLRPRFEVSPAATSASGLPALIPL